MPTFNPPLARETSVPVKSDDHDRFVHLSFTLLFEVGEDASGSWELWTDIPNVNDQGELTTGPGEWRAVRFEARQPPVTVGGNASPQQDKNSITLPPTPITPPVLPVDPTLLAEMVIPAHNASFSYTYRRVLQSGETQWLGNGGDNGIVRVFENETASPLIQDKEWKGVGIELKEDGQPPVIHQLPSKDSVKASILLLQSVPPAARPIFQVLDSSEKGALAMTESLVIASNDLRPVSIQRNSTSPMAAGLQEHFDKKRSLSSLLGDACKGKNVLKFGTEQAEEIVSFLYSPPDRPGCHSLVVHAPYLKHERTIKALLPELEDSKAPLIVGVNGKTETTYMTNETESELTLRLPAGSVAAVVQMTQSTNYPNEEGAEFWICAPDAKSQNLQYRSIKPAEDTVVEAPIGNSNDSSDVPTSDPLAEVETESAPGIHDIPDLVADDGDSVKSSDSTVSRAPEPTTLIAWMKRFLLSFWSWFFGSAKSIPSGGTREDNAEPASGTVTPNERTHLLSSPQTSAATSSTAVSPYTSPATGKADLVKTLSASSDEMDVPKAPQIAHLDHSPSAEATKKAYASFTFAHSPVHLLFAPGIYSKIASRVQYRYKRSSAESGWMDPKINVVRTGEDEIQRVELALESDEEEVKEGDLWELEMDLM